MSKSYYNNIGKPVPAERKQLAYDWLKDDIGIKTADRRMTIVNNVVDQIERDKPFEAMTSCQEALDLTGAYRLMAI